MKKPNSTEKEHKNFPKKKNLLRTTILPTNQKDKKLATFPKTKEEKKNTTKP